MISYTVDAATVGGADLPHITVTYTLTVDSLPPVVDKQIIHIANQTPAEMKAELDSNILAKGLRYRLRSQLQSQADTFVGRSYTLEA